MLNRHNVCVTYISQLITLSLTYPLLNNKMDWSITTFNLLWKSYLFLMFMKVHNISFLTFFIFLHIPKKNPPCLTMKILLLWSTCFYISMSWNLKILTFLFPQYNNLYKYTQKKKGERILKSENRTIVYK